MYLPDSTTAPPLPISRVPPNIPSEPYQLMSVTLVDENDQWSELSSEQTEMIISKSGRLMFPNVTIKLLNLHPHLSYMVYLEIAPFDKFRYKYENDVWSTKVSENIPAPEWLQHPKSPASGYKWMEKPVEFNVKLTNSPKNSEDGMVCLHSMHKYMLKVHVVQGSDTSVKDPRQTRSFPLIKTTFIAVTTYQNQKIKEVKTRTNKHAKGIYRRKMLQRLLEHQEITKENLAGSLMMPLGANSAPSTVRNKTTSTRQQAYKQRVCNLRGPISTRLPDSPGATHRFSNSNHSPTAPTIRGWSVPNNRRIPCHNTVTAHCSNPSIPYTTQLKVHCPPDYFGQNPFNAYFPVYQSNPRYHPVYEPSNFAWRSYHMHPDNFNLTNFFNPANSYGTHSLVVNNCEPHALDVNNCEPHALDINNCEPHALGVNNCEPQSLGVNNCEPQSLGVNNCEPHALSVNNCEPHALGVSPSSCYGAEFPDYPSTSSSSNHTDYAPSCSNSEIEYSPVSSGVRASTSQLSIDYIKHNISRIFSVDSGISQASSKEELNIISSPRNNSVSSCLSSMDEFQS